LDPASTVGSVFAAFGLSGAAGLNAWLPLLAAGIAQRLGVVDVPDPYDALASTPALIALALAFTVDFVGDKVPAVDHVLHAIGVVVHPLSGALLFAAQSGVTGDIDPGVALVAGAIIAGSVHAGRASVRPASTATTGGLGNPVLSALEDALSLLLSVVAFLAPVLAFAIVVALLAAIALSARALWRRWRRSRAAAG
jgi:uncharacterized protein DUF4126